MEIMETNKTAIREKVRDLKRKLTQDDINFKSQKVLNKLFECPYYIESDRIYAYVNYNQEINMQYLFNDAWAKGKTVLVPRVRDKEMDFCKISSMTDLEKGAYGIMEPKANCEIDNIFCGVMIMPGLAFDRQRHRIGYGGGFYDRYLDKHSNFYKIALCYDFQLFDKIDSKGFDIPVDLIISENFIV